MLLDQKEDKQRTRRAQIPDSEKTFQCKICNKAYLSFPALYTHKRNKHNIIPITGKPTLFKKMNFSIVGKFNSGSIIIDNNVRSVITKIINKYKEISSSLFKNTSNLIYNEEYSYLKDNLYITLSNLANEGKEISIPPPSKKPSIYRILAVYLVLIMEIILEKNFLEKLLTWAILMKECMNISGWIHELKFYKADPCSLVFEEYCNLSKVEEIPCLMDDYLLFIGINENHFGIPFNEHKDLVLNFCYWLFNHDYTGFKISNLFS